MNCQISSHLYLDPEQNPQPIEREEKKNKDSLLEQKIANLAKAELALYQLSQKSPLIPSNLDSYDDNDVYMTHFSERFKMKGIPNVVFKVGVEKAIRAIFCFQLAHLCGMSDVVVPAKCGRISSLISREDFKVPYKKVKTKQGTWLINPTDQVQVEVLCKKKLATYIRHNQKNYVLSPCGSPGLYQLEVPNQKRGANHLDTILQQTKTFSLVENEEEDSFLVPKDYLYPIVNEENVRKVKIDHQTFSLQSEGEDDIKLKFSDSSEKQAENLMKQSFKCVILRNDEGDDVRALVPKNSLFPLEDFDGEFLDYEDQRYKVKYKLTGDYLIKPSKTGEVQTKGEDSLLEFFDEPFLIYSDKESGNTYLVPSFQAIPLYQDEMGKSFILRNQLSYEVEEEQNQIRVIGREVMGMIQEKVESAFFAPKQGRIVDIRKQNVETQDFFERINVKKLIKAFLMTILLRLQDGKIDALNESNYLFQALPISKGSSRLGDPLDKQTKLKPVIIDLDGIMPKSNKQSGNLELTKNGAESVCPLRTGLMAFPQVHRNLSTEEKNYVLKQIKKILSKREEINFLMEKFTVGHKRGFLEKEEKSALNEVLANLEEFYHTHSLEDEWSLRDLIFILIPEYGRHWNALGDLSHSLKAQHIGFDSLEALQRTYQNP